MQKRFLLKYRYGNEHYISSNVLDLLSQVPAVKFDVDNRRMSFYGKPHGVSFSAQYSAEELMPAMARMALNVLVNQYGWILFENISSKA